MSSQGNQSWLMSPMPERGDPYVWYGGWVWRYERGGQIPSIEKRESNNYKMTNNDHHKLSPKSTLSVNGAWQYERVQMSRTLFYS